MDTRTYFCLIGLLLFLLSPAPSSAEITFIVSSDGAGAFTIEGDDIAITARVEMTVIYDSSTLSRPRVSVEEGTVTDLTESTSGTLTFIANQGSEPTPSFVVHLGFDRKGDASGGIFSVTGRIVERDGTITPSSTMPNPSTPSILAWGSNAGEIEQVAPAGETAPSGSSPDMPVKVEKSVLQRFREFRGESGLKAFAALFERGPGDPLVQEPSVVLSDGRTPVRVRFVQQSEAGEPPNVALSDARLVSLRKEGENGWVITVLPNEGTWNARIIVVMGVNRIEFPLAVAPPVTIRPGITERDFVTELDKFISAQAGGAGEDEPVQRIPYQYLFTANCLASSEGHPARTALARDLVRSTQ
jgi:hypothetical protein